MSRYAGVESHVSWEKHYDEEWTATVHYTTHSGGGKHGPRRTHHHTRQEHRHVNHREKKESDLWLGHSKNLFDGPSTFCGTP